MRDVEAYILNSIFNFFERNIPWWCCVCGEGGNYEGVRPDDYIGPPKDHKCSRKQQQIRGIGMGSNQPLRYILDEMVYIPYDYWYVDGKWGVYKVVHKKEDLPEDIIAENLKIIRENNPIKYFSHG